MTRSFTPWQSIWVLCTDNLPRPFLEWSDLLGIPEAQFQRFKTVSQVRTLPLRTRVIISSWWNIDVDDETKVEVAALSSPFLSPIFSSDEVARRILDWLRERQPILMNL